MLKCLKLNHHITNEADCINRLDKIAAVDKLGSRLTREIDCIQQEEAEAENRFISTKAFRSIAGFAAGGLVAAIFKQGNPLSVGFNICNRELQQKACFGTVMIALKDSKGLEDIEIIAVSRLARNIGATEVNIMSSLRNKGYTLFTPEQLSEYLDRVKENIREGARIESQFR